jgi:hypothetical protein
LELDEDFLTSLLSRQNDWDRMTMDYRTSAEQFILPNKEICGAVLKSEELNSDQLALEYKHRRKVSFSPMSA